MSDYISREHLMLELHSGNIDLGYVDPETYTKLQELSHKIDIIILSAPSYPAVPTKTGRWIGGELGYCTCCGHEGCASDIWNTGKMNFCPNCGARMEEQT